MAEGGARRPAIDEEIDRLEQMLAASADDGSERERIGERLRSLLAKLTEDAERERDVRAVEEIQSASADEIVELIERISWSREQRMA